jgi:hypothetical protein
MGRHQSWEIKSSKVNTLYCVISTARCSNHANLAIISKSTKNINRGKNSDKLIAVYNSVNEKKKRENADKTVVVYF